MVFRIDPRRLVMLLVIMAAAALPATTALSPLPLSAQEGEKLTARGTTMGVVSWSVIAYGDTTMQQRLQQEVAAELDAVNLRMSTYLEDSEVTRFNRSDSTDWFEVSPETARVVHRALEISQLSEGAFDITVQPLVSLWSFSKDKPASFQPPAADTISQALQSVGYQKLGVRKQPPAIRKSLPTLQIDLSAIAKGYAVDQVARRLQALGLENFLIEVGGEVRASGEKPDQIAWKVGIEEPASEARIPYRRFELFHKSLASSGDYRNFFEYQGQRYSHTIDPRTGFPVKHDVTSASVIATDCMTADALATAIMVLGRNGGMELAERAGVQVLILERGEAGLVATGTPGFPGEAAGTRTAAAAAPSVLRTMLVASVIFLFAVIAMAIGVIFGRERIKGSCGGIAALDNPNVSAECSLCSRAAECDDLKKALKGRESERNQGTDE